MLTPAWYPLSHHREQAKLWRTKARFVAAACGRGSGKTELARRRIVRFLAVKKPWPDPIYAYCLPTYNQAKRVAWDKLKALVPANWLAKPPMEGELVIKTVFGSSLSLIGMDKPARIEGVQWDGVVLDESCDQKPGAFDRSVRPALSHRNAWCWRIGVPKRFGCGAGEFRDAWNQYHSGALGDNYEAYTWPSHDILSEEEIRDAMRSLDQKDFDEQYGAVWQGTSGLVFYAFDEVLNVRDDYKYDPSRLLIVGSDFNVDPMAWVVLQQPDSKRAELRVVDELWLRNTNTPKTLDELHKRYASHQGGWLFLGDATSKARKTSSTASDYAHIHNDPRFVRKKVLYPSANPPTAERFAACNAAFCTAAGERRVFVSSRCKNLIHDLTTRAYVPGVREADDSDPDTGHITDALGYVIHRVWPVLPTSDAVPVIMVGAA